MFNGILNNLTTIYSLFVLLSNNWISVVNNYLIVLYIIFVAWVCYLFEPINWLLSDIIFMDNRFNYDFVMLTVNYDSYKSKLRFHHPCCNLFKQEKYLKRKNVIIKLRWKTNNMDSIMVFLTLSYIILHIFRSFFLWYTYSQLYMNTLVCIFDFMEIYKHIRIFI